MDLAPQILELLAKKNRTRIFWPEIVVLILGSLLFHVESRRLMGRGQYQASSRKNPVSSIQYPVSSIHKLAAKRLKAKQPADFFCAFWRRKRPVLFLHYWRVAGPATKSGGEPPPLHVRAWRLFCPYRTHGPSHSFSSSKQCFPSRHPVPNTAFFFVSHPQSLKRESNGYRTDDNTTLTEGLSGGFMPFAIRGQ
jgi:hypothetical protein